jgi:hypothetical protein
MTRSSTTAGAFQQAQLPVQAKLAAAWTSFMFLYIYVDYLHLYKPGSIDEILVGVVHEFDTGPTFVALALTLMPIPILMVLGLLLLLRLLHRTRGAAPGLHPARRMDLAPDHSSHRRPRPRPGPGVTLEAGPVPVVGDSSSGEQRLRFLWLSR